MKKAIAIENLIRWAFRDELPKAQATMTFLRPNGFGSSWGSITKSGVLGVEVQEPDIRNRFGLVPDFTAQADPHEDAIRLWHAVQRLDSLSLDLPADWNPLVDFGELGPEGPAALSTALNRVMIVDRFGSRHLRENHNPAHIVQKAAILGPPEWQFDKPERKIVRLQDGRIRWFILETVTAAEGSYTIEQDGRDRTSKAPKPGAYKKTYLDPDPVDAITSRADYSIWHACLGALCDELAGRLDDHEPVPTLLPAWPWETGGGPNERILVDLTPKQPYVREARPTAGPPPYRGLARDDSKPRAGDFREARRHRVFDGDRT